MFLKNLEVMTMARGLARHAAAAQALTARNIANADTPGYHAARLPSFADIWSEQGVALRATRPGHFGGTDQRVVSADSLQRHDSPNKNSVSLEAEMMEAALNRQSHELALGVTRSLGGVLRQTLSRR